MAQIVNSFSQSSANFKVGFFGLLFTVLIHIIGFSTVYWGSLDLKSISSYSIQITSSNQGLWRTCACAVVLGSEVCACASIHMNHWNGFTLPSWYKATQAMETLGLVGLILAACCSFATIFAPERTVLRQFSVLLTFLSGVCILIGVGIFAGKADGLDLHYSFGLCCFSGALSIIVTILLYVGNRSMLNTANNSGLPAANAGYVVSSAPPVVVYNQGQGQQVVNTVAQPGYPHAYPQANPQTGTQYIQGGYLKGQPAN